MYQYNCQFRILYINNIISVTTAEGIYLQLKICNENEHEIQYYVKLDYTKGTNLL